MYFTLSILTPLIANVVSVIVSTCMNRDIIDALFAKRELEYIISIALLYELLSLLSIILDSATYLLYLNPKYHNICYRIKKSIYIKSLRTDIEHLDSAEFYDNYSWSINELVYQSDRSLSLLSEFIVSIGSIITIFAVVSSLNIIVVIITLVYIVLIIPLDQKLNKVNYSKRVESNKHDRRLAYINKLFYDKEYSASLRITNIAKIIFNDLEETYANKLDTQRKYNMGIWSISSIQSLLRQLTTFIIMAFYIYMIYNNKLSVGSFVSVMSSATILRKTLLNFTQHYRKMSELSLSYEKIQSFFGEESHIENSNNEILLDTSKSGSITFENVSFSYPNTTVGVSDISFNIPSGKKVAIVGFNGSGKSTLIKLILRLYSPQHGKICINEIPIEEYNVKQYRNSIGVALQNTTIYAFSLRQNLSRYNDIDNDNISSLLKKMKLNNIINLIEGNYDTQVSREFDSNGIELSGGERQKIALASLLCKDFSILILDEPSAALDPISEYELNRLILDNINDATTIIVSHRLSIAKKTDMIIVMDSGKIAEIGTHDELIQKKGVYYDMYIKQAGEYIDV